MSRVIALGASNSSTSINKQLATWAANQLNCDVEVLDLNDFEMPIYSQDREKASGIPVAAKTFKDKLRSADGIIISFAEHNGSYSTAFKNVFDWASRIEKSMWLDKPMFLMATSPGARGGAGVLFTAANGFPHQAGKVVGQFSLPSFYDNFSAEAGIKDAALAMAFTQHLNNFKRAM